MIYSLIKRFNVTAQSDTPTSTVANLGPTTADDTVVDYPFRRAVGGAMWLAGMTRPDIANAARTVARHSHNACERHWKAAMKILVYLKPGDNVHEGGGVVAIGLDRFRLRHYRDRKAFDFGCCGDSWRYSGVHDESHTALRA